MTSEPSQTITIKDVVYKIVDYTDVQYLEGYFYALLPTNDLRKAKLDKLQCVEIDVRGDAVTIPIGSLSMFGIQILVPHSLPLEGRNQAFTGSITKLKRTEGNLVPVIEVQVTDSQYKILMDVIKSQSEIKPLPVTCYVKGDDTCTF
jgi:hypothetical protein